MTGSLPAGQWFVAAGRPTLIGVMAMSIFAKVVAFFGIFIVAVIVRLTVEWCYGIFAGRKL